MSLGRKSQVVPIPYPYPSAPPIETDEVMDTIELEEGHQGKSIITQDQDGEQNSQIGNTTSTGSNSSISVTQAILVDDTKARGDKKSQIKEKYIRAIYLILGLIIGVATTISILWYVGILNLSSPQVITFVTEMPAVIPTISPSNTGAILSITIRPTGTMLPSVSPTWGPSYQPTLNPTFLPSFQPTNSPSETPSSSPSLIPSLVPSSSPSLIPTMIPSLVPSSKPTKTPSQNPTIQPSPKPTTTPTVESLMARSTLPTLPSKSYRTSLGISMTSIFVLIGTLLLLVQ